MIGQKTINSFFTPVSKKRLCNDIKEAEEDAKDSVSPFSRALLSQLNHDTNCENIYVTTQLLFLHYLQCSCSFISNRDLEFPATHSA